MLAGPLLATKLFAPPLRADAVDRRALVRDLDRGIGDGHVVLVAPAGFGKSTLVAQWIAHTRLPVAWLSLDEDDREPLRFLAYLAAALRGAVSGGAVSDGAAADAFASVDRALRSSQAPAPIDVATELLNAIATVDQDLVLVLDDLHVAAEPATDDVVGFLMERAPARFRVIVTTREEPGLPLARLRARGRLTEFRADDLRFGDDETSAFLGRTMGLRLASRDVETLARTTEGWAAGLQLAALGLRNQDDLAEAVRAFAGGHRHVRDFLVGEVLAGIDADIRTFLRQVSVLERLCGPLCDAVTGRGDGAEMLERIERGNLFLVPLDDERRWYRFHHLFADVLRSEAARTIAAELPELHRRAGRWFEDAGATGEAIAHALAAGEVDEAARRLELAWRAMDRSFEVPTWERWAARFPDDVLRARPVLAVAVGWSRLSSGDLASAERWWAHAEARIDDFADARDPAARANRSAHVADEAAFRALPARIAAGRAYAAGATGDAAAAERYARTAVELAPDDDPGARALPAGLLGLGAWARGRLDEALEFLQLGMNGFRDVGDAAAALSFAFGIAEVQIAKGRLRDAVATYEEAIRYAARQPGPTLPGEAEAHVGLAEVLHERGASDEAVVELRAGEALGAAGILTGDEARLTASRARLTFALGDADAALALLDEAEALEVPGPVPTLRPTSATRARIGLAQRRLAEARAWADDLGPTAELVPSYVDAYAHFTVARILLARFRDDGSRSALDEALDLLDRHAKEAQANGRDGTLVEALALQGLALRAAGDEEASTTAMLAALRLAAPEGHHAVFVDEGPAMAAPLRAAARAGADRRQTRRLLAALGDADARPQVLPDFVEPLSEREHEVLRLLQGDMTGPQIARELGMSVHTFRSHTKNLYAKLGVHGRKQAVRRAGELDLL